MKKSAIGLGLTGLGLIVVGLLITKPAQILCGLRGHDDFLKLGKDSIQLDCPTCGYRSAGWDVSRKEIVFKKKGS